MGRLCVVGMGWHEEDGVAAGGNRVRRAELAEATSTRGSHTNQPAAIEPSDGSGTPWHFSVGILIFLVSFLCFWVPCLRTSTFVWEGVMLCPFIVLLSLVSHGA